MTSPVRFGFLRLLTLFLTLLGTALPAAAQPSEPPRFLLESLLVEGTQRDAVREIVAAESRLMLGEEYSEQELREAVYRVKRLPFILDAEHSLRQGSEEGKYQLVITIEETRSIFFSGELDRYVSGNSFFSDPVSSPWIAAGTVGARGFVGQSGLVFGSVRNGEGPGNELAQIGYTRYNLFGRGGFASVALSSNLDDDIYGDYLDGSLSLGIPIAGNHSLRVDVNRSQRDFGSILTFDETGQEFLVDYGAERSSAAVDWVFDTTDDPLFPTTGTQVRGGLGYIREEQRTSADFFRDIVGERYQAGLSGRRHWSLTPRQSWSAEAGATLSQAPSSAGFPSYETYGTFAGLGHALDLSGFALTGRLGDLRWQNNVRVGWDDASLDFGRSGTTATLTSALLLRNAWGLVRLQVSYQDGPGGN